MNKEEKEIKTEQQEQTKQTQETIKEEKFTIPQEIIKKYF